MQFADTQNNLGVAYRTLAEVEEKAVNCKRAIAAFQAALQVYTQEEFSELHQKVESNLRTLLKFCGRD